MLLAIDIGNSQVNGGVFRGEELAANWRHPTGNYATLEACMAGLEETFSTGVKHGEIDGCIIACVVPRLSNIFREACLRLFEVEPVFVDVGMKTGIIVKYEKPEELGADRIANAAACRKLYPGDAIIVDFGTATTFCVLTGRGEYEGGVIAPGIRTSADALVEKAATLADVDLRPPARTIGRNTMESMQSGIVYGFAELVDGIVARLKREIVPEARVVATGGLAELISPLSRTITATEPFLTLRGLQILYRMNR
jgi:type III pantothenate kinase